MPAKAQHSLKSIYQRGYDTGDTGKQRLHHTTHKATNDIYQAFDTRQQPIKETGLTGVIRSPTTAPTTGIYSIIKHMLTIGSNGYFGRCRQRLISLYRGSTCCKGSAYRQVLIDSVPAHLSSSPLFVVVYGKAGRFGFRVCISTGSRVFLFVNDFGKIVLIDYLSSKAIFREINPSIVIAHRALTLRPCAALILLATCHLFICIERNIYITLRRIRGTHATDTIIRYINK